MQEIVTQIINEIRGCWRFRWPSIAIAWALALVGWLVVMSMPNIYSAQARFVVDTSSALRPLIQGIAVENDYAEQINLVKQMILGREQLAKVARATDLDVRARTPEEMQSLIDGLSQRIRLTGGEKERFSKGFNNEFTIYYTDTDRDKAHEVVQNLLTTFVEDTLSAKNSGSETAQNFLESQIAEYADRLSENEAALAEFKKRNMGLIPGEAGDHFSRLQNERDQLADLQSELRSANARRVQIQNQIRNLSAAAASTGSIGGSDTSNGGSGIDARISELESQLETALLRFTERHPDVVELNRTIEQLKERRKAELASLGSQGRASVLMGDNPVMQAAQIDLNETEIRISELSGKIVETTDKIGYLDSLVNTAPEIEAQYTKLTRDYDVTQAKYRELLERLEKAKISEGADRADELAFEIIDRPTAAFEPVAPNRLLFLAMVLAGALGAGGALAWLLHQMKPVFNSSEDVRRETGLPVLGAVSLAWKSGFLAKRRMQLMKFAGASFSLVLVFCAFVAIELMRSNAI